MKFLLFYFLLTFSLLAGELKLQSASVSAHTSVLGDSNIDPKNEHLRTKLLMDGSDITSIKGKVSLEMALFKSDKADRDANMYETLNIDKYLYSTYTIHRTIATKTPNLYLLQGELELHGVKQPLEFKARITQDEVTLSIDASSTINVQDYKIEMPCLLGFTLCVDENVAIKAVAIFKKDSLSNTIKHYVDKMISLY